nr:MAG TPA: hypothetical protein [Caudoviricetes sp.]
MAIEKGYPINRIAFFYVYIPAYPLPFFHTCTPQGHNYNAVGCFFVRFQGFTSFQTPKIDVYISFKDV